MSAEHDDVGGDRDAVRRTLASRVSDRHLIEDLTQETLLRVAGSERRLSPDERRAYAVVTARNLLASHFRRKSVQDRHVHRLVEHGGGTDPEQRVLEHEERDALASAMSRIKPDERELLVRHEVGGTDLATLAGEAEVSSGAMAMRLARARAKLRLEFLLVFRRVALPTEQCGPVLLALAAGDQRRAAQLDAAGHVEHCTVCASLVDPMTARDRRVAGWLLVPLGNRLRRLGRAVRAHWVRVVAVLLLAVGGGAMALTIHNRADQGGSNAGQPARPVSVTPASVAPTTAAAIVPTTPPTAPPPTTVTAAPATVPAPAPVQPAPGPSTAPPPTTSPPRPPTTPGCPSPQPLSQIDLGGVVGCPFAVSVVTVADVSSGSHLTAATENHRTVNIDLVGPATGLPVALAPGVRLSISGVVTAATEQRVDVQVQAGAVRILG